MITKRKDFSVIDCGFCGSNGEYLDPIDRKPLKCSECKGTGLLIITHRKKEVPVSIRKLTQVCVEILDLYDIDGESNRSKIEEYLLEDISQ